MNGTRESKQGDYYDNALVTLKTYDGNIVDVHCKGDNHQEVMVHLCTKYPDYFLAVVTDINRELFGKRVIVESININNDLVEIKLQDDDILKLKLPYFLQLFDAYKTVSSAFKIIWVCKKQLKSFGID